MVEQPIFWVKSVQFRYSLLFVKLMTKKFFDMLINLRIFEKNNKSVWWMPRLSEAMKDAISCDKLRGGANNR